MKSCHFIGAFKRLVKMGGWRQATSMSQWPWAVVVLIGSRVESLVLDLLERVAEKRWGVQRWSHNLGRGSVIRRGAITAVERTLWLSKL